MKSSYIKNNYFKMPFQDKTPGGTTTFPCLNVVGNWLQII